MSVTLIKQTNLYIGASTDTKPSGADVKTGSKFYEYNTGKWYITYNNGTNWTETSDDTINANLQINDTDVSALNPVNIDTKNVADAMMGNLGGIYSGAATITPTATYIFNAVQVITEAVLTCTGSPTAITSITIPAGTIIYGRFTQIVIASGTVIAYQGK
ncbi:MAG: hypothetical protein PHP92_05430 [Candidatus Nanoarchaeia archaeon]|jgi:hypothetical protein|nr:hypothetical protein [Candidatus Nanoarchaeia archaeon]